MVAEVKQVCTKCGTEKRIDEFYSRPDSVNGVGRQCKECKKRKVAKQTAKRGNREYRTKEEWREYLRANKKPKQLSERTKEIARWKADGCLGLAKKLSREASKRLHREKDRSLSRSDPLRRKIGAIISGVKYRFKTIEPSQKQRVAFPMEEKMELAITRLKGKKSRLNQSPLYRKFSSIARNWRRKALGK